MISGVAIVVPARDEEQRMAACLDGIRRAVARLPAGIGASVCVVADRCTDRTVDVVRQHGVTCLVNEEELSLGAVRDRGLRHAWARLGTAAGRTWLLSTDADSVVPEEWITHHLNWAGLGAQGVAGLISLGDSAELDEPTLRRYAELVSPRIRDHGHDHVYGANLGIRADAYLDVGGFPPISTGEDRALWARLRESGCLLFTPCSAAVRTSARTRGRAVGGVADLLAGLMQ
ncbi:glycosyltransferase [Pseudonocardiaceae bacterium YIM PH 21723]|nr:glycosyltransferase [Pseudonocardiaceae bacterium YIM PH 21723]